jgi:hypothetical protein
MMNEQDFRDACAMLRAVTGASAEECFRFADEMLEARNKVPEDDGGIATIKKRKYVRKD